MRRDNDRKVIRALSMMFQFTLFLLVPVLGMGALGLFLDRKLGTKWIAILFFFIGALAGFRNIYRFAMSISDDKKDPGRNESEGGSEKKK